jgi:hypothetical protein
MTRIGALLAGIVLLAGCADVETKPSPDAADPQRAFARLKLLAGRWTVPLAAAPEVATEKHVSNGDAKPEATADVKPDAAPEAKPEAKPATLNVEYAVTSGGHTLQEKLFAGTSEEMVSMYFLEGEGLALIHYCSMGNRPHMRLDVAHSTKDDLRFEWDGTATDVDPKVDAHIHRGRIHFVDADTIECEWFLWKDGKEAGRNGFTLSRAAGYTPPAK